MIPRHTTLAVVSVLLCACGSSGGGGGPTPELQATASILFPGPAAVVSGDEIAVTGTASSPDGIKLIVVNGAAAYSDDGFATWRTLIPLEWGDNQIKVEVRGVNGRVRQDAAAVTVRRGNGLLSYPSHVRRNAVTGMLYVLDTVLGRIVRIDAAGGRQLIAERPATGRVWTSLALDASRGLLYAATEGLVQKIDLATREVSELSGPRRGLGVTIQAALDMELTADGRTLYVASHPEGLVSVDVATGNRLLIASSKSQPELLALRGISLDEAAGTVALLDDITGVVMTADVATGQKTVISSALHKGPSLEGGADLCLVAGLGAVVTNSKTRQVIWIDWKTGDRAILSDDTVGSGDPLGVPLGLHLDAAASRVLACDGRHQTVTAISLDLQSLGARSTVARAGIGAGPTLPSRVLRLAASQDRSTSYLTDGSSQVFAVDLQSGVRRVLTDGGAVPVGQGPGLENAIAIVTIDDEVVVGDHDLENLVAVDPRTGNRRVLSQSASYQGGKSRTAVGEGPDLGRPYCLCRSDRSGELLVVNTKRQFFRVDMADGARTLVFADDATDPQIKSTVQGGVIGADGALYVSCPSTEYSVYRIDLQKGLVTLLAGQKTGAGGAFYPTNLIVGDDGRLLTVSLINFGALLAIDPQTGNRQVLSGPSRGKGVFLRSVAWMDGRGGWITLYDSLIRAQLVLDPVSGDRVAVSQ